MSAREAEARLHDAGARLVAAEAAFEAAVMDALDSRVGVRAAARAVGCAPSTLLGWRDDAQAAYRWRRVLFHPRRMRQ